MSQRSVEEIREIRKDVQERYPHLVFPDVVLEPVSWGKRTPKIVLDRYAIVNQTNEAVFNICSDLYKPIFHEEVIFLVEQASMRCPEFGKPVITAQILADGGKLKVEAKFPEVEYTIRANDIVNPTSSVFSSYDLGWKYKGQFGAFRQICTNGAVVGKIFDAFKKRHLTSLDPDELANTIINGMSKFSEQTALWKEWAEEKIFPDQYTAMWAELPFSEPEKEKIEALPEAATRLLLPEALKSNHLTRWDFFNVVSQYVTHEIKGEVRRVEIQPAITKVFEN